MAYFLLYAEFEVGEGHEAKRRLLGMWKREKGGHKKG
jgi:hypothetical protein